MPTLSDKLLGGMVGGAMGTGRGMGGMGGMGAEPCGMQRNIQTYCCVEVGRDCQVPIYLPNTTKRAAKIRTRDYTT